MSKSLKSLGIVLLCAVFGTISLIACQDAPASPEIHTLTIDEKSYGDYPAVFVSLDEAKIIPLPPLAELKRVKKLPKEKQIQVAADLWLEPRDPEISSITPGGGIRPLGQDVKISATDSPFEKINKLPGDLTWAKKAAKADIKDGAVFLIKSSSGKHYKLRVDSLLRDKSKKNGSRMTISFALLP